MSKQQILALVRRYLDREIDRAAFSEGFAGFYVQVRNNRNVSVEARSLCNALMLPFAEFSRGHRNEDSFRQELENAARPFDSIVFRVGDVPTYEALLAPGTRAGDDVQPRPFRAASASGSLVRREAAAA